VIKGLFQLQARLLAKESPTISEPINPGLIDTAIAEISEGESLLCLNAASVK